MHAKYIHSIYNYPPYAPHDILSLGLGKVSGSPFWLRLSSVVWGIIFSICFFIIAKGLFGNSIGLIGTAIFATTPIFLVAARQSSAEIMLASPIAIMAAYAWMGRTQTDKTRALPVLVIVSSLALYIPGMFWWLAGASLFGRKKIEEAVSQTPKPRLYVIVAAGLIILLPLILAIAGNWRLIMPLGLVPHDFLSPINELKNIGWMASAWFLRTPFHSPLIIGRLPLLNIVQVVLLVFGAYALFQAAKNKAWALIAALAFATLAAGLNNSISYLLLGLPAVCLLITTGLRYLYVEWRGIFPRNPAAKYVAMILIVTLGAVQLLFGVRYAVIAWPHAVATRNTYVIK